jgi:malonyl-CoA O-methyltransferase
MTGEPVVPFDPQALEPAAVARAFGDASRSYEQAARLQQQVRDELLSRLDLLRERPLRVLDLGAGTGLGTLRLKQAFPRAQVLAADAAPAMLAQVRRRSWPWRRLHTLVADARQLPLADASVDLVFSSLMLQWCQPPDRVLAEALRVLRPGGLLLLSSFGPDTLRELREAWATVDDRVHVNRFVDMHDLGAALQRAGAVEPVLDVDRLRLHYPDALALMRELKAIGAHNVNAGRSRGLTGRKGWQQMLQAYEALRTPQGLPATWEVVYGVAWAPAAPVRRGPPVAGESVVSAETFAAGLRQKRR